MVGWSRKSIWNDIYYNPNTPEVIHNWMLLPKTQKSYWGNQEDLFRNWETIIKEQNLVYIG